MEEESAGIQVTVVFLAHVYPERQMSPDYFFPRRCFLLHLYRRGFQWTAHKLQEIRTPLCSGKGQIAYSFGEKVKSLCLPSDSVAILYTTDLILVGEMLVYVRINGAFLGRIWVIMHELSCCRKNSSTSYSGYALLDNILLLEQEGNASASREIWYIILMI